MTAERKAELRVLLATRPYRFDPEELLDALDAAEARIIELESNAVDAHNQVDQIRKQAARECAEIAERHRREWIRPSISAGALPDCAHACYLVEEQIRERFGLEGR